MTNRADAHLADTCIAILGPWEGRTLDPAGIRAIADALCAALGTAAPGRIGVRLSEGLVNRVVRKALGVDGDRRASAPLCRKSRTVLGLAYVVSLAEHRDADFGGDLPTAAELADLMGQALDRSGIVATAKAGPRGFSRDVVVVRPG